MKAGTANITVTATNGTADTGDDVTATCAVTVKLAPATAPTITTQPQSLALKAGYTSGNVLTVVATPASGHTLSYQWYSNTTNSTTGGTAVGTNENSFTVPTGKTAGTTEYYYCVITATRTDNNQTATATTNVATVTITDKEPATVTPPTANTLTYDGSDQTLVNGGSATNGTIRYALGTDGDHAPTTWGDTIPTGTNAGTYYVWYKAVGDNEHADSAAQYVEVTIGKRNNTTTPTAPVVKDVYANSITVQGVSGQEYVIKAKNAMPEDNDWLPQNGGKISNGDDEVSFYGLTSLTEYDIYTRIAATDNENPGTNLAHTTVMTILGGMGLECDNPYSGEKALVGETYTVTAYDADNAPVTEGLTYQWVQFTGPNEEYKMVKNLADEHDIASATDKNYTLTDSDAGKYVAVKILKDSTVVGVACVSGPVSYATATFDVQGGSPAPAAISNLKYKDKITAPGTPTRSGYTFLGWYDQDSDNVWTFDTEIVARLNIQLYAKWTAVEVHTITGTVKDKDDNAVANATVTLTRGNTVLGKTKTNSQGQFTFSAESGTYNIVAEHTSGSPAVTVTKTELVELTENKTLEVKLPDGSKNSVLDNVWAGEYAATVGGLDTIAQKETPAAGVSITITLTVTDGDYVNGLDATEQEQFNTGKTAIQNLPNASGKTVEFLDLKLEKTVVTGGITGITNIGSSNTQLLTIILPFDKGTRQNITVYRYHGDTAAAMTENPIAGLEGFKVGTDTITIYSRQFSTYAIGYTTPTGGSSGGGGSTSYPISVNTPTHGTVKPDRTAAVPGTTVTLTLTPDEGYEPDQVIVTDPSGKKLTVTDKGNGKYTFTMPRGKVEVNVTYKVKGSTSYADCPKDETCPIWPFPDAETTAWYHDGVHYVLAQGIMVGYDTGLFGPADNTTRAMMAQILFNMEGKPATAYPLDYADVDGEAWYAPAIRWATAEGVMEGYGGAETGTFGPEDPVTREQLVTILYRYAKTKGVTVSVGEDTNILSYDDAFDVSQWAVPAMQWAVGAGAVEGRTESTLNPLDTATRAEIATIIMRYCTQIIK